MQVFRQDIYSYSRGRYTGGNDKTVVDLFLGKIIRSGITLTNIKGCPILDLLGRKR